MTRTLRLDQELDQAIAKRASDERVSVNFLVNRCVRKFVEWEVPVADFGMVTVPKLLLDKLAGYKDGDALEGVGREVAKELIKPAAEYITGEFTVKSSVEILNRASIYGKRYGFDFGEGRDSHNQVLVLRHDQGLAWSRYYFGVLDETFRVLLNEEVKISYTNSLCVVQLPAR